MPRQSDDPNTGEKRDCLDCHGTLVYVNGAWLHEPPADDCPSDRPMIGSGEPATEPDVSDAWGVVSYTDRRGDVAHQKAVVEHTERGVSIFARELPNGGAVHLRVPANLPGGFDVVHKENVKDYKAAIAEAERFAAMYDTEGTWLVDGAPVLH